MWFLIMIGAFGSCCLPLDKCLVEFECKDYITLFVNSPLIVDLLTIFI